MNSLSLNEAMVLWSPRDHGDKPRIKVVRHAHDNSKWNYLEKSMGACWAGWEKVPAIDKATHFFGLFTQISGRDNVPGEDVQKEFLKIDEYRQWTERNSGPFSEAYYRWQLIPNEAA